MDRVLDRAFNDAMAKNNAEEARALAALEAAQPREHTAADDEAQLRGLAAPMAAGDAIERMLLAWKDRDYFRLMALPPPEADELGRVLWGGTAADVSRAYRRLSLLVHPDKNPGPEAQAAFEALKQAHKLLKEPGDLETILNDPKLKDAARRRRADRESALTLEQRVALNAQQKERAAELQRQQGESFQAEMVRQARERLEAKEAVKRKRAAGSRYRREAEEEEEEPDSEGESDAARAQRKAAAAKQTKRAKPRLIF